VNEQNVKIEMVGKGLDLTPAIKQYVEKKIGRVYRYFDKILNVKVVIEKERQDREPVFDVEVTLDANGKLIRAEMEDPDLYAAVDKVADKLESNIKRFKEKLFGSRQAYRGEKMLEEVAVEEEEKTEEVAIEKRKRFLIRPMSEEEAVLQMESLGHTFFVFLDPDSGNPKIVYKRKRQGYGVIEVLTE
jgi:putative sigma-54 modulation protein